MNCPICGYYCENYESTKHLPRFFRCLQCSGYFHRLEDKPSYSELYFNESNKPSLVKSQFSGFLDIFLFLREKKIKKILTSTKAKILDYGCGNGKLVAYLKTRGFDVNGYDPSLSAVKLAQENNLPVYRAIPESKYDLMMFWHSLEHSDTPLNDLKKCKQYLFLDAKLLIAVPNGESMEAKIFGQRWFCYDWPFHRVHFTPKSIKILLEKAGFKIVSIDYFNPEYTASSLAQTFLNLFLPHNALYSFVANRRILQSKAMILLFGFISIFMLILFSPFLIIFFLTELFIQKTAAIIVVAENIG